jgi:hypothetical protein
MGSPAELTYPPLAPEGQVYRAYPFTDSFNAKTGKPAPKLFYRKLNEEGLSVGLSLGAIKRAYPNGAGACSLIVNDIRACDDELDVIQDAPEHAEIVGIPLRAEDEEKAIRIARYLARIAEDCSEEFRKAT